MDSIKVEKKDFDMKKFCFCLLSAYTKEGFCNPFFKHFFASIIEMGKAVKWPGTNTTSAEVNFILDHFA